MVCQQEIRETLKNTLEFLDVYLQKYGQGYVSNLLEHEGWQNMADPVTGKQLIFQDNDFQKATFTTGQKHEVDLSISGGTEAINYYVGLRYLNQDGILRGTNYKNYSVLFNGNYKLSEAWSLSTKASLQVRDAVGGGNTVNTISRSILTPPTYRLYYEDGTPAPEKVFLLSEVDCMKFIIRQIMMILVCIGQLFS